MKKIFLLLVFIYACFVSANAETKYVTIIQGGYPNELGYFAQNYKSCDAYELKIDGTKYFLMDGNGTYSRQNFLGCSGQSKFDMFTPLRNLEKDGANPSLSPPAAASAPQIYEILHSLLKAEFHFLRKKPVVSHA